MPHAPFSSWPAFTQEEADAAANAPFSGKVNYWTGHEGRSFEKEFATLAGTKHAIALSNGTLALELAWQGLSIGSHYGGSVDDEAIVTSRTVMASISSVTNAGARPVFADVGRDSGNIEPETVAPLITAKTRAILCVHLAGWPCDMDGLRATIGDRDIKLVSAWRALQGASCRGLRRCRGMVVLSGQDHDHRR